MLTLVPSIKDLVVRVERCRVGQCTEALVSYQVQIVADVFIQGLREATA